MPLGLAFGCTTPPPETTTLAHPNGLNPSATNILTFLGKECEYSAKVSVFYSNICVGTCYFRHLHRHNCALEKARLRRTRRRKPAVSTLLHKCPQVNVMESVKTSFYPFEIIVDDVFERQNTKSFVRFGNDPQ